MNATSYDIVQLIEADSALAYVEGTDIFYSRMPVTPQECIAIYDNSGPSPMLQYVKARSNYFYENISIRSRAATYYDAMFRMQALLTYLHGRHGDVINSTYYAIIRAINTPSLLHHDENNRPVIIINFEVQRKPN